MANTHYLVVDFEATCCDDNSIYRQEMEIIEFGAVMVRASDCGKVSEFQSFVRPVRHPRLTPFCTQLTSIRQTDVDRAPAFAMVMTGFLEWSEPWAPFLFCSWGDYDRLQLQQDCRYHKLAEPFDNHCNLKQKFTDVNGLKKRYGMARALELVGVRLTGVHHRGIDDARNIASLLPYVFGQKRIGNGARQESSGK